MGSTTQESSVKDGVGVREQLGPQVFAIELTSCGEYNAKEDDRMMPHIVKCMHYH